MSEHEGWVGARGDGVLERAFAGDSDEELMRQWDEAFAWRDWDTCDLIIREQDRRAGGP